MTLITLACSHLPAMYLRQTLLAQAKHIVCLAGLAMLLPFIQDIVGLVGALELYPLTVFLPIQMHIKQAGVLPWTSKWVALQLLSMLCLSATAAGCIGSAVSLLQDVQGYKPFQNTRSYYS